MKLTLSDLLQSEFYPYLPSEPLKFMTDKDYLVFFYWYEDKTSNITDIKGVETVSEITLNLNRKRPVSGIRPYDIGFFQAPFDTQSIMFYQFLKYYFVDSAPQEKRADNQKRLFQFFAKARAQDLQSIEQKQKDTFYENSFNIYSRDNFISAVDRFVQTKQQVKDDVVRLADCVDTYCKSKKQKGFFGDILKKVVMALKMPSGELIPEKMGKMRYLYYGELSEVGKSDEKLAEAKTMLRNNFLVGDIYTKTGWFFNKNDQKWRKRIQGDATAQVPKLGVNEAFIPTNSIFRDKKSQIFDLMNANDLNSSLPTLERYIREGYDVTLGQVLQHNELYKHYPSLFKTPIFYATNSKALTSDSAYAFFYNDSGYLFMYGNEGDWDLKTVLLHEVQHAIQHIEGFGQGGDLGVAKMIQALGGEGVKEYFFISNKLRDMYSKEANHDGTYSYERYSKYYNGIKLYDRPILTEEQYYNSVKDLVMEMINSYLNADDFKKNILATFLGASFCEKMESLIKYFKEGQKVYVRLKGQGYNPSQIKDIFFKNYEHLAGEIESRDVQHTSQIEEDILGYALPLTSESIEQNKVTSIYKNIIEENVLPNDVIRGAVETNDGEYIIHLFENVSAVPILHELGHIVCDIVGKEAIELALANKIEAEKIEKFGGLQEVFVQIFLNYISKQPLSPRTINEIKQTAQFEDIDIFNEMLDEVFYPKPVDNEKEFQKMIFFVKKLDEITEGFEMAVVPVEKIEEVVVETPIETPIETPVENPKEEAKDEQGFVSVSKNITNLNQLKNHLKLGTVLKVSYNKNKPDWVGTLKIVSYVQTNGIYLASGTEIPKEAEGTDKPFSVKGLSWLEYPKASNFKFMPNGFEILYKDKDGNLMPFLGYEYVEKVGGSSTEVVEENSQYSQHIERMLAMDEKQLRSEIEELKKEFNLTDENLKIKTKEKDEERQRLKENGYNNFQINTRIGSWVREIELYQKQKRKLEDTITEKSEIADRVAIVKNKEKSNEKIKELVDYINANRQKSEKPTVYFTKESDIRKYLGCFVYLYTDKKPRPNLYDLIDFYSIFGLEFLMKNEFDNIKKLSDTYLTDFRSEAERLKEDWRAENPLPKIYDKDTQELHRGQSEKYAKQKIKENAREFKMVGA